MDNMDNTAGTAEILETGTSTARAQLLESGYCIVKNVLDRAMIDELARVTDGLLDAVSESDRELFRYQGSNIFIAYQHAVFARLFAWPAALNALATMGFPRPKWLSSFLLSKPPHGLPLYWHQDWAAWGDPCSADISPPQIFLMYYLTDTCRENGCLRVIPGTHRKRIALHDQLPLAHTDASFNAPLDSPGFCTHPDERDITVCAGDLVIGDARLLHAAHPNRTNQRRTCLTLWYAPDFESLSEPVQKWMARQKPLAQPEWWPGEVGKRMEPLVAWYHGSAESAKFDRQPNNFLK
jgi:ectoine hydroxylase-related dioxygenase (phytanoyl-CoA dioxygenase family)